MMTKIAFVYLLSTLATCPPGVLSQLTPTIPKRRRVNNAAKLDQESPMEEEERRLLDFSDVDLAQPISLAGIEWLPIVFHDLDDVQGGGGIATAVEVQVSMSMSSILCMSISPSSPSIDIEGIVFDPSIDIEVIVFDAFDDTPIESVDSKTAVASSSSKTAKSTAAKSDKRPVASHAAKATKRPATAHSAKVTKGPVASPTAKTSKSTAKSSPIETEIAVNEVPIETHDFSEIYLAEPMTNLANFEWLPTAFHDPDDVQVGDGVTEIAVYEVPIETPTHGTKIEIDQVTNPTKPTELPHTKSAKAAKVFKSKAVKRV